MTATVTDTLGTMVEQVTGHTVFGEPVSQDGTTVIPVARIGGWGGGGTGTGPVQEGREQGGTGGGGMLSARPVGVFVLREGKVAWRPSVDVNRVILGGQMIAVVALLTVRAIMRRRRRRH